MRDIWDPADTVASPAGSSDVRVRDGQDAEVGATMAEGRIVPARPHQGNAPTTSSIASPSPVTAASHTTSSLAYT
jgi:hypothetical protein